MGGVQGSNGERAKGSGNGLSKRLHRLHGVIRCLMLWAALRRGQGNALWLQEGVQLVDILLHQGLLVERQQIFYGLLLYLWARDGRFLHLSPIFTGVTANAEQQQPH